VDFKSLVGQTVWAIVPFLDQEKMQEIRILAVERAGLWIESDDLKPLVAKMENINGLELRVFLPFHEMRAIVAPVHHHSGELKSI
jgi:hypothetical protein